MFRISTTFNFDQWRTTAATIMVVAVAVRMAAALVLLVGPWTDQASELSGWDVERFVEIANTDAKPWAETEVEYPPGSVVVLEAASAIGAVADDITIGTHRVLVVAMLACDLLTAWLLGRTFGRRASVVYLVAGLPLVPMGLLRLDLLTTALAAAAVVTAARRRSAGAQWLSAAALGAGAAVKLWPALLITPLWLIGRRLTAAATAALGAAAVVLWLWWADAGLDPVRQVLTLRGATGWHVESTAGLLVIVGNLIDGKSVEPMLEFNAFRVGTISSAISTGGRLAALATLIALSLRARAADIAAAAGLAAVILGSLATLLATAPLFSPQFMLWLTPWVAIVAAYSARQPTGWGAAVVGLTVVSCLLTGATLTAFGPSGLATAVPAVLLIIRNAIVALLPVACWFWLGSTHRQVIDRGASPGFQLANPDIN